VDAANLLGGDTVLVGNGTYVETVSAGHGGAAGLGGIDIDRSVTLRSLNGKSVTTITATSGHCLPGSCPGGNIQLITLSASKVTIDGFTILTTGSTTNLITANGDAASDNHVIKNNTITNPAFDDGLAGGGWGILLGGTDVDGADNNLIDNNEISLNPDPEKDVYTFGIGYLTSGSNNNTISNNYIHDAGGGGFTNVADTNGTVSGNTFSDNARYGWVDFGSASGSTI